MKKILSIALALCMLLTILPMSVSAAAGDALENSNFASIWSGDMVTVEAGATAYFETGSFDPGEYNFTVSGAGDFTVAPCGLGTDTWYTEGTPIAAVDGVVNAVLLVSGGDNGNGNYGGFAITNNSTESASYLVTVELPVGSQSNPATMTLNVGSSDTVEVPAGGAYYINVTLPEAGKQYQLTVTGNTGFRFLAGMGMPAPDTNGKVVTTVSCYYGPAQAQILNNTDSAQTYTLSLDNMPLGTEANPDTSVVIGENTATITNGSYYYEWVAEKSGLVTVTMDDEAGWQYGINVLGADPDDWSTNQYGDSHWYDDATVVSSETYAIEAGGTLCVYLYLYNTESATEGTINWSFDYIATGDEIDNSEFNSIWNGETVTVGAGETAYFELGNGAPAEFDFSVTGAETDKFILTPCGIGTDPWYTFGTPVNSDAGVATATLVFSDGSNNNYGYGGFAITNKTTAEISLVVNVDYPLGSQNNPVDATLDVGSSTTVTVPAGEEYYINVTPPETGKEFQLTVTGNTGFGVSTGWMPTWDTNGSIITTVSAYFTAYSQIRIVNNTASEQTYTLALDNMPVGSQSNPDTSAVIGQNTANITNNTYYYEYVAEEDGYIYIQMDDESGWQYSYNIKPADENDWSGYHYGDTHWATDSEVVTKDGFEIKAGETFCVLLALDGASEGTINWTLGFEESTTGTAGNLTWILSGPVLEISGTGEMPNFTKNNVAPWGNDITHVIIYDGVTSIGNRAFFRCLNLESVTIADSVTHIGNNAFFRCESLEYITLPANLTSTGIYVFRYSGLKSITIPESLTSISMGMFDSCVSLAYVTLPYTLESVDQYAFLYNTSLVEVYYSGTERYQDVISIAANNNRLRKATWYCDGITIGSTGNVHWELNGTVLTIFGEGAMGSYPKHAGVDAPWGTDITELVIEDGVADIGVRAFYGCASLTTVSIGNSVIWIGNNAFNGCSSITTIDLPDSVTSIYNTAFENCSSLTEITLSKNATYFGNYCFYGTKLATVNYRGTEEDKANIEFTLGNNKIKKATWVYAE